MPEANDDLLTALKAMLAWIGGMSFTPPSLVVECDALIAQAQAAIAKAEGPLRTRSLKRKTGHGEMKA